jgi:hypothetical protein
VSNELMQSPETVTHSAIDQATRALEDVNPSPFTENAFKTLKENIAGYIEELISESSRLAKRYRSDAISATHVERASEYLLASSSRRVFRHLGTVGGLLFGAALSNLLSMTTTATYNSIGIIVTCALGFAGAFMIALHISKD